MRQQKIDIVDREEYIIETQRPIQLKDSQEMMEINLDKAHFGKRKKTQVSPEVSIYNIVHKYKIQRLVNTFINKLRMNSVYRQPCLIQENEPFLKKAKNKRFKIDCSRLSEKQGLSIGNIGLALWSLVNIIQITIMVFIYSIIITFPETQKFKTFFNFRIFSIALYIIDMFLNLTVKRYENGKNLQKLGQIATYYLKNQFAIDIASILIFPFDAIYTFNTNLETFIFFFSLIKLVNNIRKFQKMEYMFINSSWKQHYYGLVKVLATNFAIAHFLSIALNWMAQIDPQHNWRQKLGVDGSEWYIRYIWGYYWGTNIMFTVGFGDLCATNWYEAAILVFIQAFSCITLAYNISYIGGLISSLGENEKIKKKKLKIFHRMCQEHDVQKEVQEKVTNFIEEEHRIKEEFQYETHDQILNGLPQVLQASYRQSANRCLFSNLGLLSNLFVKDLTKLTQVVQRKVCHPEQIILKRGSIPQFIILQNGCLSLTCRIRSSLDGKQMEVVKVKEKEKPIIISLDFLKNKLPTYNIKSNSYSVIFSLTKQELMESLKTTSQISFQTVCAFKDKDARSVYETQTLPCSVCKAQSHTKFQCNRLHYVPLARQVLYKYIHKQNEGKQLRRKFIREKKQFSSVLNKKKAKFDHKRYVEDKYDDKHFKQMQNLYKFYTTIQETEISEPNQFRNSSTGFLYQAKNLMKLSANRAIYQLEKLLESKQSQSTDFWEIECDSAENFKYYFKQANPQSLRAMKKKIRNFYSMSGI